MNILLMVADDLGYGDVDHNGGKYGTEGINYLAERGVVLNSYYGHHNCTPSRACFMTGRYASRYGLQEVLWPWSDYGLSLKEKMLSTKLKKIGYTNYIVGKWHLGYLPEYAPLARDFDYHYGCYATPHYYNHINYGGTLDWMRNDKTLDEEGFITDLLLEDALKVIRKAQEPFFLYVPFTAPHKPILPPPEYTGGSKYASLVRNLDKTILAIYKAFQNKNPNNMTIFCVDNGSPFQKNNNPLRGKKHTLFEGGIRLPAVVTHPNLKPGKCNEVIHAVDIYPTILKQCGASINEVDGQNIMPVLKGKKGGREEILFNANGQNWDGIRMGDFKYIVKLKTGEDYLFNVREDPYENANLIGRMGRLEKSVKDRLNEFRQTTITFLKTPRRMA